MAWPPSKRTFLGSTFTAVFSRSKADGQAWVTLDEVSREATFDGQVVSSGARARRNGQGDPARFPNLDRRVRDHGPWPRRFGRLRERGISTLDQLITILVMGTEPGLSNRVVEALLNNETYFFRDRAPFDLLARHALPQLAKRRQATRRIRIWSAGCSTGQEPYTIGMDLLAAFPELKRWDFKILATDIDTAVLAKAVDQEHNDGGTIWILEDVTLSRQNQMESEALMNNASISILFTRERTITRHNRGFAEMFRYGSEEANGMSCEALYPSVAAYEALSAQAGPLLAAEIDAIGKALADVAIAKKLIDNPQANLGVAQIGAGLPVPAGAAATHMARPTPRTARPANRLPGIRPAPTAVRYRRATCSPPRCATTLTPSS